MKKILNLLGMSLLFVSTSFAASQHEIFQLLPTATGIADSSFYGNTNAAGLSYNGTTKLALGAESTLPALSNYSLTGGLYGGNGSLGAGALFTYPLASGSTSTGLAGMGLFVRGLNTSIGANVEFSVTPSFNYTGVTPGLIINPYGRFRVGASFNSTFNQLGFGLAGVLGTHWVVAADVSTATTTFTNFAITPGIKYGTRFQLSAAYGFNYSRVTGMGAGSPTFGLGAALGQSAYLTAYLSDLTAASVVLAFKF